MNNVMVDLETMGTGPDAAIVAIGAVAFDPSTNTLGQEFYMVVDLESSVKAGLVMTAGTVMWWLKQADAARAALGRDTTPLDVALSAFQTWYPQGANLWGNGSDFDNVILASAYRAVGLRQPWPYHGNRCYRTLKNLTPVDMVRVGVHHNALDDAKTQAQHAMDILRKMGAA